MNKKGVPVKVGDQAYRLIFNLDALFELQDKYETLAEMSGKFQGPAIEEGDSEEVKAEKLREQRKAEQLAKREIPWLVALMANQGLAAEAEETGKPCKTMITEKSVKLNMRPAQLPNAMNAVWVAIGIGMQTEHEEGEDEKKDLVLEELDRKNGESAAE